MWYPPPVVVPRNLDYLGPLPRKEPSVPTAMMWQMIPFDQQVYFSTNVATGYRDFTFSVTAGRKFILNKSVFDLIKVSHFLELTDPKLLGWYLCLPAEDRKLIQEEGGFFTFLQNHPALEVTRHIVHLRQQVLGNNLTLPSTDMSSELNKSRHPTFYGASFCPNCGASCPSRTNKCRNCYMPVLNPEESVPIIEGPFGLLPNSVKEELNLVKAKKVQVSVRSFDQLGCIKSSLNNKPSPQVTFSNSCQQTIDGLHPAQTCPGQREMHSNDPQYLSQLWEEEVWKDGTEFRVFKDPSAQASFTLDVELESQCLAQKSDQDQVHTLTDTTADFLCLNQETPPEYYSFNSTGLENTSTRWSDATESLEPGCSDSLMATKGSTEVSTVDEPAQNSGAENRPFPDSVSYNSSEWTNFTDKFHDTENDSGCEPKADKGQRLVCQNELNVVSSRPPEKCEATSVPLRVSQAVDATSDFRALFTSTQATKICQNVFAKPCRDIAVGTDSFTKSERDTQTTQMSTSEKCIVTAVRMSDLDVLSEEFERLKMMEEEFKCLKDKMKRSSPHSAGRPDSKGQSSDCGCGAVHRARRAELRLLALQFVMCQQHCWRRFYTSPLGETALQGTKALPDVILQTLKTLEDDYLEMKRKILAGIHLDNLDPLSVDTFRITTGTFYSPALVFEDYLGRTVLEDVSSSRISEDEGQLDKVNQEFKKETIGEGIINRPTPQPQDDAPTTSSESSSESKGRRCRAVHVLNQQSGISSDTNPDLNHSEAWFDAEEELASAGQGCQKERQMGECDGEDTKMEQKDDRNRNAGQGSLLCVTDLPSNITEGDLLLWFEQYHVSQVSLTFNKNNRAAIVIVRSPSDAEAAVREVNGRSIQGHTLHVEHIHMPPAGVQGPIKASCAERFPAACKAEPEGEWLSTDGSKTNFQASRPPRCSLDRLINVQDKPSASGTCVPQHYATMGSFDTLMARLSERHPGLSRQRLVGALLDLRAKHQGFLSGLPLRVITDMASDLLTKQSPAK